MYTFYTPSSSIPSSSLPKPRDPQEDMETVNFEEWNNYYGRAIPKAQLWFLVYKMPAEDLGGLAASLSGNGAALSDEAKTLNAAFSKYGKKDRVIKSLDYL